MKEKKWVQHISGHGEKWEVVKECSSQWGCESRDDREPWLWLPKSEYTLCKPPATWVDITADCNVDADGYITHNGKRIEHFVGYRARKKRLARGPYFFVFIIEQKVPA